jgi:hypothetical protein
VRHGEILLGMARMLANGTVMKSLSGESRRCCFVVPA